MSTKTEVYVVGRLLLTGGDGGKAVAPVDVCKTPNPPAPVPVPYPNVASCSDLQKGSAKVFVNDKPVMLKTSHLSTSTGDEVGSLGGLVSGKTKGRAEPISGSKKVSFDGVEGVCNGEPAKLNDGNTVGVLVAKQGAPPVATAASLAEAGIEEEEPCDICKKVHAPIEIEGTWSNARNQTKLVENLCTANGWHDTKAHPWYLGRYSVQVHHLLPCEIFETKSGNDNKTKVKSEEAAKSNKMWAKYLEKFKWDLNGAYNAVALPGHHITACILAMPLHRGPHDQGYCYNLAGEKLDKNEQVTTDPGQFLIYADAVKNYLQRIVEKAEAGDYCVSDPPFKQDMIAASEHVLKKIKNFEWTLRADALNYKSGGIGCENGKRKKNDDLQKKGLARKTYADCRNHIGADKDNVSYKTLRKPEATNLRLELKY